MEGGTVGVREQSQDRDQPLHPQRIWRRTEAALLEQAGVLEPQLLHHQLQRSAIVSDSTIHRATGSTALAARWAARPFTPSQILSPAAQKEGIMAGALGRKSGRCARPL